MNAPAVQSRLPAVLYATDGTRRVDYRAVMALAWPLLLNTSIQAILNLTDTYFLGRLSSTAQGGVGGIFFLVLVFVVFLGGVGQAVQTMSAQSFGAGAKRRAASFAWNGLWASVATIPLFVVVAFLGAWIIAPFGLAPELQTPAVEYWMPRMMAGWLGTALWGLSGFFNGIGRTRLTLIVAVIVGVSNGIMNQLFMFQFGWGVAGCAWATGAAQLIGVVVFVGLLLGRKYHAAFRTRHVMKPRLRQIWQLFKLGVPMGMAGTADLAAFAFFQLMLARLGTVESAASQIVMMLTSLAYMPGIGFALAGTTLVGQSIGAGDKEWAQRTGSATIRLAVVYMGGVGVLLALAGPRLVTLFSSAGDVNTASVITLGTSLLWIAAGYQLFDALNLGSAFCLRGAGDVRFPAAILLVLAWGLFVPATHTLMFDETNALIGGLPQFGMGARGAWLAALGYIFLLGMAMMLRWKSGAWKKRSV
jgi:MATE family multidrug resistance protein